MVKKTGCKKSEIKFKGRCYPKKMEQSSHAVLDWKIDYGFKGNRLIMKNLEGCVLDDSKTSGKCSYGAVAKNNENLAKTINGLLKKFKRKTIEMKIPDAQWKSKYDYTDSGRGNEKENYLEEIKVGSSKYGPEYFYPLLNEVLDEAVVTKSKTVAKKKIGDKIKLTYWQGSKDTPIIMEGKTGLYVLAPRVSG